MYALATAEDSDAVMAPRELPTELFNSLRALVEDFPTGVALSPMDGERDSIVAMNLAHYKLLCAIANLASDKEAYDDLLARHFAFQNEESSGDLSFSDIFEK